MLKELTKQQESMMPIVQDKWFNAGWSTDPANREEAERGVRLAYDAANLPHPTKYIWQGSPLTGAIAAGMLHDKHATYENLDDKVNEWLRLSEAGNLPAEWKKCVQDWRYTRIGGQHWAGYYSYYDFYNHTTDELRAIVAPIEGQMIVALNSGWWWVFENAVILTERPTELHMTQEDDRSQRRMHCTTGPAIRYPDGFRLYFVNGQPVPEHVIERPELLTVEMVDGEGNAEVRRVMIELMGAEKYLEDATLLDEDVDELGLSRRLWFREVKDDAAYVAVELLNSTAENDGSRRKYFQRVPPETASVLEGAAWLAGKSVDEFRLVVQS